MIPAPAPLPVRAPETEFVPVPVLPGAIVFSRFIPIRNGKLDHSRAVPMIEFRAGRS